ncbi:erythromycin esterase family protein [Sphingobacterium sp. SYP-B4668]|uniref:erythromycin esterase family protein n=1 Tax=Sphingobacterium sp. SYP-B4668 TaxID=2996035 RepID=UPI0022DE05E4|nr:erythromycin esterase family protein [Sphingobacterium sp. SYP-B4668]
MNLLKNIIIVGIFSLYTPSVFAQAYLNLDFESQRGNKLNRWAIPNVGATYTLDSLEKISGSYSLKVNKTNPSDSIGAFFRNEFPVEYAIGRELILKGKIKTTTKDKGNAGLMLIVLGENNKLLLYDDMKDRRLTGNSDWQEIYIKAKIDSNAKFILFGGICAGQVTAWFDDFKITIDGKEYNASAPRIEALSKSEIEVLREYCYPLKSFDPMLKDQKDLKILDKLVADAKIVALGEVSHGSSEIFKMKHRLIQYLAEKNNFDIFSMEANMPEAYQLNVEIAHNRTNNLNLLNRLYFWCWNTSEISDMIRWMGHYNKYGRRLTFSGFDMQYYQGSIRELKDGFGYQEIIHKEIDALSHILAKIHELFFKTGQITIPSEQAGEISEHLKNIKVAIDKKYTGLNNDRKEWLLRNVRILEQFLDQSISTRDKYMAENLMWILGQNKDSKVISWAHNGHIKKKHNAMGQYLSSILQDKYIAMGFAFYEGEYTAGGEKGVTTYPAETAGLGSYEYFLNSINEPFFILDLKRIKEDRPPELNWLLSDLEFRTVGAVKIDREFRNFNIANNFDYLIFIKKSTNSHLLN